MLVEQVSQITTRGVGRWRVPSLVLWSCLSPAKSLRCSRHRAFRTFLCATLFVFLHTLVWPAHPVFAQQPSVSDTAPISEGEAAESASESTANESTPNDSRPKIGLVLSGGGARGAAHVGVIKVLERNNVPVDYIVGTSLGSVVGALYATGKSPAQLVSILANIDWNKGFIDDLPRERLPMRRKDEEDTFQINFELGVKGGALTLPSGVIQGHSLHLLLKSLLGGASLIHDFDLLPIPFRAIASDLEKAETVVLGAGDLASSLRASMAIPAVFAPVEIDGRLLVDGGVTNNLAVDAVREMGADIVIAVDISTPLASKAGLTSVVSIVDQLTNIITRANVETQIETLHGLDVYIQPDLENFSSSDFGFSSEIVALGEKAALELEPLLARLSVPQEEFESIKANRSKPPELPDRISDITFTQNSGLSTQLLRGRAGISDGGVFIDGDFSLSELHQSIDRIYATDVFERVEYFYSPDLNENEQARKDPVIEIEAVKKSWGGDNLRFGFTLEDNFEGDNNFTVSAGYTRKAINRLGGDLRVIGQLGELPRFLLEYFQPFDQNAKYYSLLALDHQQYSQGEFSGGAQIGDFRLRRNQVSAFIGWQNDHTMDVRAGVLIGAGRIQRAIGDDEAFADEANFNEGVFQFQYRYDSLDSITFPSSGKRFNLRYEIGLDELNTDDEYDSISLEALFATRKQTTRYIFSTLLQSVLSETVPIQRAFSRGSLLATSGLRRNAEVGQLAARATAVIYRPLTTERVEALEYPIYFGSSLEVGRVFDDEDDFEVSELLFSGNVFVAADTPVGPVFLGLGASQGEDFSALLSLGLTF